ncbi:TetR/AcrR family transcriptional regulator [Nonomuraea muscovyensis]|uniref:AcrR family transcriptional regulator n=1 Tax=Nonomuraea muscovyensis TaxID=1124761 RepID=A0A7X0C0K7_9ACTN|nr:TetR/AcrR family transcriptional regulator [Nonomuraea muscovyensis]MBB6345998.1 AcrR family transcriptional regulator [Nonomuraea muscovyensis]MDF2709825.1 putative transcriptional regulator, TetR family [Nonomuraea muscovyensis]
MARPRAFDEERVLDAAMRAFWAGGYEGTSTRDLCAATGLDRSSVYNAFTSKHELFKRALTRYLDTMTAAQVEILGAGGQSAAERVRALLAKIIDDEFRHRGGGPSIGCLSVNTTVELAGHDEEISRLLDRDLRRRLDSFEAVIEEARRAGDIVSDRDSASLARYLNAVIAGIRVSAKGGAGRADLEAIAATALDVLVR